MHNVGPEGTTKTDTHPLSGIPPSGLDGPTAIFSRSDIFKRPWCTTSDLQAPTYEYRVDTVMRVKRSEVPS